MRRVVAVPARIHARDSAHVTVVYNLSEGGCAFSPADLAPRSRIKILIDGAVPISAVVVWCKDERVGCRFLRPLSDRAVEALSRLALESRLSTSPMLAPGPADALS